MFCIMSCCIVAVRRMISYAHTATVKAYRLFGDASAPVGRVASVSHTPRVSLRSTSLCPGLCASALTACAAWGVLPHTSWRHVSENGHVTLSAGGVFIMLVINRTQLMCLQPLCHVSSLQAVYIVVEFLQVSLRLPLEHGCVAF